MQECFPLPRGKECRYHSRADSFCDNGPPEMRKRDKRQLQNTRQRVPHEAHGCEAIRLAKQHIKCVGSAAYGVSEKNILEIAQIYAIGKFGKKYQNKNDSVNADRAGSCLF